MRFSRAFRTTRGWRKSWYVVLTEMTGKVLTHALL
jgi:hypothetical protein